MGETIHLNIQLNKNIKRRVLSSCPASAILEEVNLVPLTLSWKS